MTSDRKRPRVYASHMRLAGRQQKPHKRFIQSAYSGLPGPGPREILHDVVVRPGSFPQIQTSGCHTMKSRMGFIIDTLHDMASTELTSTHRAAGEGSNGWESEAQRYGRIWNQRPERRSNIDAQSLPTKGRAIREEVIAECGRALAT